MAVADINYFKSFSDQIPWWEIVSDVNKDKTLRAVLLRGGTLDKLLKYSKYDDIKKYEISTGNGYVQGGKAVVKCGDFVQLDSVINVELENVEWTAEGGKISATHAVFMEDNEEGNLVFLLSFTDHITDSNKVTAQDGGRFVLAFGCSVAMSRVDERRAKKMRDLIDQARYKSNSD